MTVQPRPPEDSGAPAGLTIEASVDRSAIRAELEAGGAVDRETARELRNVSPDERERVIANAAAWRVGVEASARRAGFASIAEYLAVTEPAEEEPQPEPEPGQEEATLEIAWPDPIDDAAYHGLVGEIVREIEPTTEADPIALLLHLLAFFGNAAGIRPHVMVEDTEHGTNEFVALVGATSKSRKGTAERRIRRAFEAVDPAWVKRIKSGLSSGEGLIYNVRDAIIKDDKIEDEGEPDKRLLALESELATTLRRIEREGSSLSAILRDAWDRRPLDTLVSERSRPAARASENHISVVGHITRSELTRYMSRTEMANGLGNRILWGLVKRSKYLPRGARPPAMAGLIRRLHDVLEYARGAGELDLDRDALGMWNAVYPSLSDAKSGLAGEMVARGEPHVLRLALIYALLDQETAIRPPHLLAALAVWSYCEESVFCIFGAELGDPDADAVLAELLGTVKGLTTTELSAAFNRHWEAARLARAVKTLVEHGAVTAVREPTKTRPAIRYQAHAESRPGRPAYLATARRVMRECELCEKYEESPEGPSVSTNERSAAPQGTAKNLGDDLMAPEILRRFFADSSLDSSQTERGDLSVAGPRSADSSHSSLPARDSDDGRSEAEDDAEPSAYLDEGDLEGHAPVRLAASETIVDVPAATRRWLSESEPVPLAAVDPAPIEAPIECADYRAHQTRHRFTGTGWTCDVCHPANDGPETAA